MPNTTPSMLDILSHTPVWVWAIFGLLIYLGWQRTKDRTISVWRLLLLPAILGALAISGYAGAGTGALPAIVVGLIAGGVFGWLLEREGATRRLDNHRLWLRGEWWSFAQVVLIFVFRYVVTVAVVVSPMLAANTMWHLSTLFVSSLLTALLLGRTAARLRVYFVSTPATTSGG